MNGRVSRAQAARLLLRLSPKSMSLQRQQAGADALTPQDIAAALGAAARGSLRNRIAVDVLCLRHWPAAFEGAQTTHPERVRVLVHPVRTRRRAEGAAASRRPLHNGPKPTPIIERLTIPQVQEPARKQRLVALVATRLRRSAQTRLADNAEAQAALASRLAQTAFWVALARSVLAEYAAPNPCQCCHGAGEGLQWQPASATQAARIVRVTCDACVGQGEVAWHYKRRAKAVQMRAEVFRRWLNPLYAEELALLRTLAQEAMTRLARRIGA